MTKRQAIRQAQQEANALIDQLERLAKGWDKGAYRDDDTMRIWTVQETIDLHVNAVFSLSVQFA